MSDLSLVLGGLTLPNQTSLIETTTPNEVVNQTLSGEIFVDWQSISRSWSVGFPPLTKAQYDDIYSLYRSQYTNSTFLSLVCTEQGIHTIVKVAVIDKNIRWNGNQIKDWGLTLTEQYAIS